MRLCAFTGDETTQNVNSQWYGWGVEIGGSATVKYISLLRLFVVQLEQQRQQQQRVCVYVLCGHEKIKLSQRRLKAAFVMDEQMRHK